jgi:arylsulfate sulfotransferase
MNIIYVCLLVCLPILVSGQKAENFDIQDDVDITFSSGKLIPDFSLSHSQYYLSSLNTINDIFLKVTCNPAYKVYLNDSLVRQNLALKYRVARIHRESKIVIKIDNGFTIKRYTINTYPDDFPRFKVYYQNPTMGDIYLTAVSYIKPLLSQYIFILDQIGNIKFYNKNLFNSVLVGIGNFQKVVCDGKTRYFYYNNENEPVIGVATNTGTYIVLDEKFDIIKKVRQIPFNALNEEAVDMHDFLLINDNHYYIIGYDQKLVYNIPDSIPHSPTGSRVAVAVIQEILDNKVIWNWVSSDYPEFYGTAIEANNYLNNNGNYTWADYMHINSIFIDPKDGNIIASFRHQDQIIKIDKKNKQILWKLGGMTDQFGLTPLQKFSHQHTASYLKDGSLMLFDNGNKNRLSRVLEFKLDEKYKKVLSFKAFSKDNQFSTAMGSVQKVDDVHFIGWGARQNNEPDVTEINFETQKISFELFFENNNYYSYRAYKFR